MSDTPPTFTGLVTGTPGDLKQSLNLWKLQGAKMWFLRVHSIGLENRTPRTNYSAVLTSSLVNVLEQEKKGENRLVNVPLQVVSCGLKNSDKKVSTFAESPLFRINNLAADYFWYLTPVIAGDTTVSPDFNKLKVVIHYSLYGV